jgi:hypothetical protein
MSYYAHIPGRRLLRVEQWETTRYWVSSATRAGVRHLVDVEPWGFSCEWACDFAKDGHPRTPCAHQRAVAAIAHAADASYATRHRAPANGIAHPSPRAFAAAPSPQCPPDRWAKGIY